MFFCLCHIIEKTKSTFFKNKKYIFFIVYPTFLPPISHILHSTLSPRSSYPVLVLLIRELLEEKVELKQVIDELKNK
jgi:hypothetical protein